MAEAAQAQLDLLDRRIMHELDLNARASASQLARHLRRSKETINFRLNRLLREGFLKGFYTVFSTSALGWFYAKAYLKFKDTTPQKEKEIFEYLAGMERVAYLSSVEGEYDCLLLFMVKSMAQADSSLSQFMKRYGEFIQEKDICIFLSTHRLNQKFLLEGKESRDWHYPYGLGNYALDAADSKLLRAISSDARLPLIQLAKKCGLPLGVAKYRLKKLEKGGIILAYVSSPNFEKLGLQFFQVNITLRDPSIRRQVVSYFDSTTKCLFAIEMLGKYDVLAELHVQGGEELRRIVDGFREKFVGRYTDYDVSTITKEYVVVWGPFAD